MLSRDVLFSDWGCLTKGLLLSLIIVTIAGLTVVVMPSSNLSAHYIVSDSVPTSWQDLILKRIGIGHSTMFEVLSMLSNDSSFDDSGWIRMACSTNDVKAITREFSMYTFVGDNLHPRVSPRVKLRWWPKTNADCAQMIATNHQDALFVLVNTNDTYATLFVHWEPY